MWVQVPSSAEKQKGFSLEGLTLFVFLPRSPLKPRLQGLLGINASSVGSVGKRSTGPFSISTSPHLPLFARLFAAAKGPPDLSPSSAALLLVGSLEFTGLGASFFW